MAPPEYCAVANSSQVYGKPPAWGWSDINCAKNFIFMCRLQGGWRRALAAAAGHVCMVPRLRRLGCCGRMQRPELCMPQRLLHACTWLHKAV